MCVLVVKHLIVDLVLFFLIDNHGLLLHMIIIIKDILLPYFQLTHFYKFSIFF